MSFIDKHRDQYGVESVADCTVDLSSSAETINGLYKAEVIHKDGPWRGLDDVERATLTWVEWFNNLRLLRPIGDIRPAEYEMQYYNQSESSNVA